MRLAKKGLGLLLTLILAITLIGVQNVSADNATVPDFTVKAVSKGTAAKGSSSNIRGVGGNHEDHLRILSTIALLILLDSD